MWRDFECGGIRPLPQRAREGIGPEQPRKCDVPTWFSIRRRKRAQTRAPLRLFLARGSTFFAYSIPSRARIFRRSEEHTSELQSQSNLVCRLLLEKKKLYVMVYVVINLIGFAEVIALVRVAPRLLIGHFAGQILRARLLSVALPLSLV